jgi:transcriptional regulator with XRE-family HTH domain
MNKEIEINILLGQRLFLLRNQRNLSKTEFAKILHISHQQLDKYEKGLNRISAAKIAIICYKLQINSVFFYSDLILKQKAAKTVSADLNTLITYFRQINKISKRKIIIQLIKKLIV